MPSLTYSSISDVERATGVPKETLRVCERRYAFPQPKRDEGGNGRYPADQVARLCLIKRLLDVGGRVGKLLHCTDDELNDLVHATAPEALVGSVDLATVAPSWLKSVADPDWFKRYAQRAEDWRLPGGSKENEKLTLRKATLTDLHCSMRLIIRRHHALRVKCRW